VGLRNPNRLARLLARVLELHGLAPDSGRELLLGHHCSNLPSALASSIVKHRCSTGLEEVDTWVAGRATAVVVLLLAELSDLPPVQVVAGDAAVHPDDCTAGVFAASPEAAGHLQIPHRARYDHSLALFRRDALATVRAAGRDAERAEERHLLGAEPCPVVTELGHALGYAPEVTVRVFPSKLRRLLRPGRVVVAWRGRLLVHGRQGVGCLQRNMRCCMVAVVLRA